MPSLKMFIYFKDRFIIYTKAEKKISKLVLNQDVLNDKYLMNNIS